ncbi:AAA-like domain-containing protein [Romeriopsis navalis]|nr:AAA-like domain-containing protein [Romeriopsis navalis]
MKRKRGVLLSARGWQRLQAAEQRSSEAGSGSKSYTLQELSDLTGLSANTLARVRGRKIAVDQHTLDTYFQAFDLTLAVDDYSDADSLSNLTRSQVPPSGQLALDSKYYIQRPPIESLCIDGIFQPGGLVRIKAPRMSGKTSLVARTLLKAREQQKYSTVILSLRLADSETFSNLNRFLKWFCAVISQSLGLANEVEQYWDDLFGASYNCTHFFESYLLKNLKTPLVLALDEVDTVFDYPELATDFFGMLRAWYEKARYGDASSELWQKLRLIMVHSTEVYVPLNIAQSPFNAGLLVEPPCFNLDQAIELAKAYGLSDPASCGKQLMQLVGGRPHLLHLGMYHLHVSDKGVKDLTKNALSGSSIFSSHLRNHLWELQKHPELLAALKVVVSSNDPVELAPLVSYKLQSRGLVMMNHHRASVSCDLYQVYFQQTLSNLEEEI